MPFIAYTCLSRYPKTSLGGVVFSKYIFWYFSDVHHTLHRLTPRQKTPFEAQIRSIRPEEKNFKFFEKNLSPQNDPISDFSALKYESLSVSSHIFQLSENEEQKIISIRRTVLIQSALDDPDYGEAFKYHEHTCSTHVKFSN